MDVSLQVPKNVTRSITVFSMSCSQSSCQLVLAIKFQFLLMWTYGPASTKLVLAVSCYLLYGWCRHWASGVADGWKVCRTKGIHYSAFSVHGKCPLWTHMQREKKIVTQMYPAVLCHISRLQAEFCVCLCVTHPSECVTLLRHSMCPVAHPVSVTMLARLRERRLFLSGREEQTRGFM